MTWLRRVALWAPFLFVVGLEVLRTQIVGPSFGAVVASATFLVVAAAGIVFFSHWVFTVIETARASERRALTEARRRHDQLEALREASLALTAELDLDTVLQKVVDMSREVVHARYGVVAVLDETGEEISRLVASGPGSRRPSRLDRLLRGSERAGGSDSDGAARAKNVLRLPIAYQERELGYLYLTDKRGGTFSPDDEHLLEQFATQAAVAIANAHLYEQVEEMAILKERERIGMDLHDGTIQSLYALGLSLEGAAAKVYEEPGSVAKELDRSVDRLFRIIGDIRHYIFDLKMDEHPEAPLRDHVEELLRTMGVDQLLAVTWAWDDSVDADAWDRETRAAILHILREALANVARHARTNRVSLQGRRTDDTVELGVIDDGCGFDVSTARESGRGLGNMMARARAVGGDLVVKSEPGVGTEVLVRIPVEPEEGWTDE